MRTLSAMVLRTSSVLILESATALTDTERLTASCEGRGRAKQGVRKRGRLGDDGRSGSSIARVSRSRRLDERRVRPETKRRRPPEPFGSPSRDGTRRVARPRADPARGCYRDRSARIKYRGSFFPRASPAFGAHLGLRDLHAVEGGGAEGAGGASLRGRGAGREDSDGGDDGGHDYGCVVGCDSHPSLSGAFPPADFLSSATVAKKQNQRLFSHTKSPTHPRRSPRIGPPFGSPIAESAHSFGQLSHQPERGRADRRAFWQSPIRLDSSMDSVGRTRRPATALLPDGSPSRFPDALARVVVCLRRARSMVSDGRSRVRGPVDVGVEG